MGLDNGFLIKSKNGDILTKQIPENLINISDTVFDGGIEIAYFRKCWGLRNMIVSYLRTSEDDAEVYEYDIQNPEEILDLINIILHFMDRNIWEQDGQSIWTYDQAEPNLKNTIINLTIMYFYLQNHEDIYLSFYDSY